MRRWMLISFVLGKACGLGLWLAGAPLSLALTVFFGSGLWLLGTILIPSAQGLGRVYTRFEPAGREVWLTLDDGPDPDDTPRALTALARHDARATFFLVGKNAAQHPGLVAAIAGAGHEIANHTHTHPVASFWCAGRRRVAREIDSASAVLARNGRGPARFRPPVGIKPPALHPELALRSLTCVGWSLRSWDSVRRNPDAMVAALMRKVTPGSIILLHEGPRLHPDLRREGLARLLAALSAAGYRCVVPPADRLR